MDKVQQASGGARQAGASRIPGRRISTTAGLIAPPLFAGITVSAGLLRSGYDPVRQTISALAVGPGGWLQTAGFAMLGALSLAFAFGFAHALGDRRGARTAGLLTGLLGLLALLFAVFPTDAPGEADSLHGYVHDLLVTALALYFPIAVLGVASVLWHDADWRKMARFSAIAGIVGLSLAVFWLAVPAAVSRPWKGLYERVWVGVQMVWLEGMALKSWTSGRMQSSPAPGSPPPDA